MRAKTPGFHWASLRDASLSKNRSFISKFLFLVFFVFAGICLAQESSDNAAPVQSELSAKSSDPKSLALPALNILRDRCLSCHDAQKHKGDLRMTSREELLKGGAEGVAVVPGKADESRLISYLLPEAEIHMPPKGQLEPVEIQTLRDWINADLPWDAKGLLLDAPAPDAVKMGALPDSYHPVFAMALSADQGRLAAGRGNRILIYDLAEKKPEATPTDTPAADPAAAKAPANAPAVPAPAATPAKPAFVREIAAHEDAVRSLAWSPDGKWLASGSFGRIALHDMQTFDEAGSITDGLTERVTALAFAPDSATLYSADGAATQKGLIKAWKLPSRELAHNWEAHADSVTALILDPTGKRLISAGVDGFVRIWDTETFKQTAKFEGHTGHVLAVALSPDAKLLASGSADNQIKIWDIETGEQKITIVGHPSAVTALWWTTEGKKIASACEDGALRLSIETRESPEKSFAKAPDVLYSMAATADGKKFFGGCHDGQIYFWNEEGKKAEALDLGK